MFLFRSKLVAGLTQAWDSYKALLHTDVCEVCGEPCEPQSSVITACVPACNSVSEGPRSLGIAQATLPDVGCRTLRLAA
jgi:hypothetical protein